MKASCRSLADMLEVVRGRGISLAGLTDGLEVEPATLDDHAAWVPWDEMVVIMDRVAERIGGLDAYRDLVGELASHPNTPYIRRFLRIASTPARTYYLVFRWLGPSLFPMHTVTMSRRDERTIELRLELPEHVAGSAPFFYGAWGAATALPRLHGLPDAQVDADVSPHHAHLVVHLPANVSLLGRARRWVNTVADAPGMVDEVIRQQDELHRSYQDLQRSYEEVRRREAQLHAEMDARLEAQAELRRRTEQLLHAQRVESVGRLAGGVAHDFNNLLTAILGYTDILAMSATDERTDHALTEIRSAAERAANLTRQLLTFGRKQPILTHKIDLNELVTSLQSLLQRLLGDVEVRTELSEDPVVVLVDRTQLEQVLLNLVVNARDAMPDGGTLTVRTEIAEGSSGPMARLIVEDDGVGMEAELVERIFEPFFTTKGERGTGLGLATAFGIVEGAGGRVEVESRPGEGSRFVVELPAAEGEGEQRTSTRPTPVATATTGTILVIEDEPALRRLLERALVLEGHDVLTAGDGASALEASRLGPVDLVISDVMLGRDRGPIVVAEIKRSQPEARVLLISGYVDSTQIELPAGIPLLKKPFQMAELHAKVQELLRARLSG